VGSARLPDYSLAFAGESKMWGGSTATIIPDPGSSTPGVLYLTDPAQEKVLTWFENADNHADPAVYNTHKKVIVTVDGADGRSYPAYTFINISGQAKSVPSGEYLDIIQSAYDEMLEESLVRTYIRLFIK